MRKSSILILLILLIAFGGMLLAADMMVLRPARQDLAVAGELKGLLGPDGRDWIEPESKLKLMTCKGEGDLRLAQDGSTGIAVELEPRRKTLYAKRRARFLVDFVANKVRDAAAAEQPVTWVEVIFRVGEEFPFKTLVRWDAAHEVWIAPEPAVPERFKPEDLPPLPPDYGTGGNADG